VLRPRCLKLESSQADKRLKKQTVTFHFSIPCVVRGLSGSRTTFDRMGRVGILILFSDVESDHVNLNHAC
jgi:hypothetical protein